MYKLSITANLAVVSALVLALTACDEVIKQQATATASPSIEQMMAMSMENMEKVMMMSPAEQREYVMRAQQESMAHGQALFADARLGSNGFTCATCHPKGDTTGGKVPVGGMQMAIPSLIGVAGTFPKYKVPNDAVITLAEMNNNCIVMFMKGQPLPLGSRDARDLALYMTTLSEGEKLSPGKQSM